MKYRSGRENKAADALSRLHTEKEDPEVLQFTEPGIEAKAMSTIKATWMEGL